MRGSVAAMAGVSLRDERAGDRPFLRELYGASREHEPAAGILPRSAWASLLDQQFEMQMAHYHTAYPGADYWIVEQHGRAIGRLYVHADESAGEMRVLDIGLLPECRGRGIGTALLARVIERARERGCSVWLQVEMSNPARRLYGRMGFREMSGDGPFVSMRWVAVDFG